MRAVSGWPGDVVVCLLCRQAHAHVKGFRSKASFMAHVLDVHGYQQYAALRSWNAKGRPCASCGRPCSGKLCSVCSGRDRLARLNKDAERETLPKRFRETLPGRTSLVLRLLDGDPSVAWTGKQIARKLDGKFAATRIVLSRLLKEGRVLHPDYGIYQSTRLLVRVGLPDPRLRFHGLKVFALKQLGEESTPPVLHRMSVVWASPTNRRNSQNGAYIFDAEWNGRLITATAYRSTDRVEVWLNASLKPLNLIELHTYFAGVVPTGTGIPPELWTVQEFGANFDLPGVKKPASWSMSIPDGISVAGFEKVVFRVYQKVALDALRVEGHFYASDQAGLQVDDLLGYIRSVWASVEATGGKA